MTGDIIVLKIGTKTLIDDKGQIRKEVIRSVLELADRRIKLGEKILIVTSGAVATGRRIWVVRTWNALSPPAWASPS